MNEHRWNRWLLVALTILIVAVSTGIAYNVGLSQGLAQAGAPAGAPPAYAYGWHRPWGLGPLFPLLFIFFWVFVIKSLWWRPWGHWGPWRYGSYYGPPPPVHDRFDEWHRQAHERMASNKES
jgi:hypothetical protein